MLATEIRGIDVSTLRGSRWSTVRWCVGVATTALWLAAAGSSADYTVGRRALYLCALMGIEAFATMSATLMLLPSEQSTLHRVTNWLAIIFSIMAWVPGCTAAIWLGLGVPEAMLLIASVLASFGWFAFACVGTRNP